MTSAEISVIARRDQCYYLGVKEIPQQLLRSQEEQHFELGVKLACVEFGVSHIPTNWKLCLKWDKSDSSVGLVIQLLSLPFSADIKNFMCSINSSVLRRRGEPWRHCFDFESRQLDMFVTPKTIWKWTIDVPTLNLTDGGRKLGNLLRILDKDEIKVRLEFIIRELIPITRLDPKMYENFKKQKEQVRKVRASQSLEMIEAASNRYFEGLRASTSNGSANGESNALVPAPKYDSKEDDSD